MLGHQSTKYQTFADVEKAAATHPLEAASWAATLLFSWAAPLVPLANTRPLEASDLWPLQASNKVHAAAADFDAEYHTHGQSIVKAFFAVFGKRFALIGVLKLLATVADLAPPVLLYLILQTLATPYKTQTLLLYGGSLVLTYIVKALARAHLVFQNAVVGIHLTSALRHMLFEKALGMHTSYAVWAQELSPTTFSTEVMQVADVALLVHRLWLLPLHIAVGVGLLYYSVGSALYAGIAVACALLVLYGLVTVCYGATAHSAAHSQHVNARMKELHKVFSNMEMVKWNGWENACERAVLQLRDAEEAALSRHLRYLWLSSTLLTCAPALIVLAIFVAHSILSPGHWPATLVFPTLALVYLLQAPCALLLETVQSTVLAVRALQSMQSVLLVEQVDDTNVVTVADRNAAKYARDHTVIAIHDGTFHWHRDAPSVLSKVRLRVTRGDFVVVHGARGTSSLCAAILGEMHKASGTVFLGGSIAYVAQTPWVQRLLSIRENILFGKAYDRAKYQRVIDACALNMDFLTFPLGDRTEPVLQGPSAKTVVLTPAQEARISLARACYSDADIYLVDHVLAAMDANVAGHIFRHCFLGVLLHKTLLLVSNDSEIVGSKYIDATICVADDGSVTTALNTAREKLPKSPIRRKKGPKDHANLDVVSSPPLPTPLRRVPSGPMASPPLLVPQVELTPMAATSAAYVFTPKEKRVAFIDEATQVQRSLVLFIDDDGLRSPHRRVPSSVVGAYLNWRHGCGVALVVCILLAQLFRVASDLWLTQVAFPLDGTDTWLSQQLYTLGIGGRELPVVVYCGLLLTSVCCISAQAYLVLVLARNAATRLFRHLLHRALRAPLAFFDSYPLRRLLNRFRDDMYICDVHMLYALAPILVFASTLCATLLAAIALLQVLGILLLPWTIALWQIARDAILPVRELQRLLQQTQAPLSTLVAACVEGSVTIRAYGNKQLLRFYHLHHEKIEAFAQARFATIVIHARTSLQLQLVAAGLQATLLLGAVSVRGEYAPSVIGLLITYSLALPVHLDCIVHMLAAVETWMGAPERLLLAAQVEQEQVAREARTTFWFPNGRITFDHVALSYKPNDPAVLNHVSLVIAGGETIAFLGRPGAGKSCMAFALFRLYALVDGRVSIDDVDVGDVDITSLRQSMAIVPQYPTWLHATVRGFLDPDSVYLDHTMIWTALDRVALAGAVQSIGLNTPIDGDHVFSLGERQLLCLARAILRQAKILVVDEASPEIEATLQRMLAESFASATVLVMTQHMEAARRYDRVVLMDSGDVVGVGPPTDVLPVPQPAT
ncbi:hypothetical protein SPRG_00855 [Saprolegnia parasitica CBS 223.65]|uniref:Uncharacterized protein n=1 Tax=Saprolegnia parasitica (strain CBS 223.65) TaxID=695850 RepID=A0A067CVS7_SAPPC|nr:hypothetical protein SPRG_00855 [Saprolegnia parasitica CBS 223.65]KDO34794.1 hypothetical protein SPRG_00855 [Saprolegnia parasitica CBS 223.65]|eukprot:XP_012194461.1 hypothetical protein SPRG_00855 [Saprolegnia parasitica CBS 223.65]